MDSFEWHLLKMPLSCAWRRDSLSPAETWARDPTTQACCLTDAESPKRLGPPPWLLAVSLSPLSPGPGLTELLGSFMVPEMSPELNPRFLFLVHSGQLVLPEAVLEAERSGGRLGGIRPRGDGTQKDRLSNGSAELSPGIAWTGLATES